MLLIITNSKSSVKTFWLITSLMNPFESPYTLVNLKKGSRGLKFAKRVDLCKTTKISLVDLWVGLFLVEPVFYVQKVLFSKLVSTFLCNLKELFMRIKWVLIQFKMKELRAFTKMTFSDTQKQMVITQKLPRIWQPNYLGLKVDS